MKTKMLLILFVLILLPLASANDVDDVDFPELPTAWETGEDLEFSVEASGSSLDNIRFQSRPLGDSFFRTVETFYCENRESCSRSIDHTENSEGTWEYRFRAYAGDDRKNSVYREVTYFDDLDYSVSWIERPPSNAERGDEVGMSVEARDDADRFDSEGELSLQYRDNGGWNTFDSRDCSSSSSDSTCSNRGTVELDDEVLDDGEADFRGLVTFKGDVTETSSVETVSVEDDRSVDRVVLENLPSRHPEQTDIDLIGEASGNRLEEMELRWRAEDEISWNTIETEDCDDRSSCEIEENNYEHPRAERGEIQAVARAGNDERTDTEFIEFTERDDQEVDSVELDDLPSSYPVDDELEITGEASGESLESLTLEKREEGDDWESVDEQSCSGSNCDFEYDYEHDDVEEVDFRLKAEAGEDEEYSDRQEVDFYDPDSIDEVNIEDLPNEHPVDEELEIEASAEGDDLDELEVQESDRDEDDWSQVEDYNCDGDDECSFTADYTADEEEEKDFRVKAYAEDGSTDYSGVEEVDFVEEDEREDRIDSVDIDDLPSEYSTDNSLDISGEASGRNIDEIEIQYREDGGWERLEYEDCGNSDSCSISDDFTADEENEIDFRIRAEAGGDTDYSSTETVNFVTEGFVDSVSIGSLPANFEVGESLEVNGEASGTDIDTLEILTRERDEIGWNVIASEDCSGGSCDVSGDFIAEAEEGREFVVRAMAGRDTVFSSTEYVEFTESLGPEVSSVSLDSLPDESPLGSLEVNADASGRELDSLEIQFRENGGEWEQLETSSCSGSSCSLNSVFEASSETEIDFRARAEAGDDEEFSNLETVVFSEETDPEVSSVSIDDLPDDHPVETNLDISGEASGVQLDTITLQERRNDEWQDIDENDCSGSSCSILRTVNEDEEASIDYRIKAEAGDDTEYSSTETVEFFASDEGPGVDTVIIEELPSSFDTDESLGVEAEASGNSLESLELLYRQEDRIAWRELDTTDCEGDSCILDSEYTAEEEERIEFVAEASAGDEEKRSATEVVTFRDTDDGDDGDGDDDDDGDDAEDAELDVSVEDLYGNELENVRVEASNGETKIDYTDEDGEVDFDLEEGEYDVEASKTGYRTETQSVNLDAGEEERLRFRLEDDGFPVRVVSVTAPSEVCEGNSFEVDTVLTNNRDRDITVAVGVEGDVEGSYRTVEIQAGDAREVTLEVDRISGIGEKELSVTAENDGSHSRDFVVDSEDCEDEQGGDKGIPSGITINSKSSVIQGETVKISGDIQNVESPENVEILVNDEEKEETTSSRTGRYQSFVQLNEPGRTTLEARTGGVEARKTVNVLPRSTVNPVQAPNLVRQGESFEVCAEIESTNEATVVLEEEGEVIESKDAKGETCFDVEASEPGDKLYRIRAINSGVGGSASDTVKVIEQRPEVESFPEAISTVETEPGLAKVTLYNAEDSVNRYEIRVDGVNAREVSQTSKEEVIAPGDQEVVYLYFNPSESGEATIDVLSDGVLVDERSIDLRTVSGEKRTSHTFIDLLF